MYGMCVWYVRARAISNSLYPWSCLHLLVMHARSLLPTYSRWLRFVVLLFDESRWDRRFLRPLLRWGVVRPRWGFLHQIAR